MKFAVIVGFVLVALGSAIPALAQEGPGNVPGGGDAPVTMTGEGAPPREAPSHGEAVIDGTVAADDRPIWADIATFRLKLAAILSAAPAVPGAVEAALLAAGDGSLVWLLPTGLIAALALGAGALAHWYARRLCGRLVLTLVFAPPETRAGRIGRALEILMRGGATTIAFLVAGISAVLLVKPGASPERDTAFVAVLAVTAVLALRTVFSTLLSPERGAARLLPLTDAAAHTVYTRFLAGTIASAVIYAVGVWLRLLPMDPAAGKFLVVVGSTATFVIFCSVSLLCRRQITAAILGTGPRPGFVRRTVSVIWPGLLVAYFATAWITKLADLVAGRTYSAGPVLSPAVAVVVALAIAGILLVIHDRRLRIAAISDAWSDLYEKAALAVGALVGAVVMLWLLGLLGGPWAPTAKSAIAIAITLLAAWLAWQGTKAFVAIRLAEEEGPDTEDTESEGFGGGGTRLATLLPIFRNVVIFIIATVALTVVLSSLGVNVAPLFAGAGVLGLAIGFGAQSLIRDIFSGAFFLLDDAFRKGEYVDVGGTMGMVESISVRSFQLRHHEGRLHTVPFGEIKRLTNFSRDWVIMKLPVRLTYDTDVEKVRKLVKRLGQDMAADPELGPLFLEPPKSQGVVQMDDSAMIMRVKFKTKPGDQFLVRRHVYQRLRDLFDENHIPFAHREVLVRVAGARMRRNARTSLSAQSAPSMPKSG